MCLVHNDSGGHLRVSQRPKIEFAREPPKHLVVPRLTPTNSMLVSPSKSHRKRNKFSTISGLKSDSRRHSKALSSVLSLGPNHAAHGKHSKTLSAALSVDIPRSSPNAVPRISPKANVSPLVYITTPEVSEDNTRPRRHTSSLSRVSEPSPQSPSTAGIRTSILTKLLAHTVVRKNRIFVPYDNVSKSVRQVKSRN